jgi:nicotinamidase-related amidase
MKPQRIQLRRVAGFNLQAASLALNGLPAKVVTRATAYGNPYHVGDGVTAKEACAVFKEYAADQLKNDPDWLEPLRGFNLACFCSTATKHCHAETLLRLANRKQRTNERTP